VVASGTEPIILLKGNHCRLQSGQNYPALTGTKQFLCDVSEDERKNTHIEVENIEVVLSYPQSNPALSTLVQFERANGDQLNLFNGPEQLSIPIPRQLTGWEVAKQYIVAGVQHILEGYDHLLFILCLTQIAGNLRRFLITITGFTLAHSVTLGMATLGVWTVRVDLIESLIALSIVMLAVEIVKAGRSKRGNSLAWLYPACVAALFGLLHGFGFASALGELGLPQAMKIPALAYFNVGVELGQMLFVAVILLLITILRRLISNQQSKSIFTNAMQHNTGAATIVLPIYVLYLVGIISAYWFVDRVAGIFL
jgi:hydrogenase/urease accessory protein HupE